MKLIIPHSMQRVLTSLPLWTLLPLLFALPLPCSSSPTDEPATALKSITSPGWSESLDRAVAQAPEYVLVDVYQAEAKALKKRSSAWIAAAPTVGVQFQTDALHEDRGYQEAEIGVDLPLWRLSQRHAAQQGSDYSVTRASIYPQALRLLIASRLRNHYWDYQTALTTQEAAEKALQTATKLEQKIRRLVALGEAPSTDLLATTRDRLLRQQELDAAKHSAAIETKRFHVLTSLRAVPKLGKEPKADQRGIEGNALLKLAQLAVKQTAAEARVTQKSAAGQPSISLLTRQERVATEAEREGYVGLGFNLPIGAKTFASARYADALRKVVDAKVEYQALKHELELAASASEARIKQLEQNASPAKRAWQLAQEQWRLATLAFENGEMSLLELLRVQNSYFTAQRDHALSKIALARAIAAFNQAIGVTP